MKIKYEYSYHQIAIDPGEVCEELDKYGKDGWDLCCISELIVSNIQLKFAFMKRVID